MQIGLDYKNDEEILIEKINSIIVTKNFLQIKVGDNNREYLSQALIFDNHTITMKVAKKLSFWFNDICKLVEINVKSI